MVDRLAGEYAGRAVFLEYDALAANRLFASRNTRYLATGLSNTHPRIIVDSGNQSTNGYHNNFYDTYKAMVDASLVRPALATLAATAERSGDHIHFRVTITNLSGETFSKAANDATVHGIVYEELDTPIQYTHRWVRAVASVSIDAALAPGASASFTLDTPDLPAGTNWARLHYIALADYRPAGDSGTYDTLQAAVANQPSGLQRVAYLPLLAGP